MAGTSSGYVLHAATVAGRSERAVAVTIHGWIVDSLLPNPAVILNLSAGSGQEPEDLQTAPDLFQPPRIRAIGGEVHVYPRCGHLYWEGSHVRRIRRRLESFAHGGDEDDAN
jgi:hypothetical protein